MTLCLGRVWLITGMGAEISRDLVGDDGREPPVPALGLVGELLYACEHLFPPSGGGGGAPIMDRLLRPATCKT